VEHGLAKRAWRPKRRLTIDSAVVRRDGRQGPEIGGIKQPSIVDAGRREACRWACAGSQVDGIQCA